jgi:hypothetical protein
VRTTNFKVGWNVMGGADGHLRAPLEDNMTRLFVGSFKLTIDGKLDGGTLFTAENTTGLHSALLHIPGIQDVQRGEGPFANQSQTFWWTEASPCGSRQ